MEGKNLFVGLDIGTTKIVAMIGSLNEYNKLKIKLKSTDPPSSISVSQLKRGCRHIYANAILILKFNLLLNLKWKGKVEEEKKENI